MDDPDNPPSADRLAALVTEAPEDARAYLKRVAAADAEARKDALRRLRNLADEQPAAVDGVTGALEPFLGDDERAVRLSSAKLAATVAGADADAVRPLVPSLRERLADEAEFYYVRARAAEALGYVALDHPDVADPELLAELRVGLSFDEPEVAEKLAKALEHIALGNPGRLRHQVSSLAAHLDDGSELVRYHLCTALAVVGCEHPAKLADAAEELAARLDDESPYVRGRAAEALGLLARSTSDGTLPLDDVPTDGETPFVTDRLRFARNGVADEGDSHGGDASEGVGTLSAIRRTTDQAVDEIISPSTDGECPSCGLDLPADAPPMCPRCGSPH